MDKNYIYIIRRREHVRTDEDIYKIGHTTRGIDRLKEYGTGIEIHGMFPVDSKEAERSVIELFNGKYERIGSSESYKGNIEDMVKDIKNVCKGHTCNIGDMVKHFLTSDVVKKEMYDMTHTMEFCTSKIPMTMKLSRMDYEY